MKAPAGIDGSDVEALLDARRQTRNGFAQASPVFNAFGSCHHRRFTGTGSIANSRVIYPRVFSAQFKHLMPPMAAASEIDRHPLLRQPTGAFQRTDLIARPLQRAKGLTLRTGIAVLAVR